MKFKVTGRAKYEYDVEAEDEDTAITLALELFEDGNATQDISSVLVWEATVAV